MSSTNQLCAVWREDEDAVFSVFLTANEAIAWRDGVAAVCQALGGAADGIGYIVLPLTAAEIDNHPQDPFPGLDTRRDIIIRAQQEGIDLPDAFLEPMKLFKESTK